MSERLEIAKQFLAADGFTCHAWGEGLAVPVRDRAMRFTAILYDVHDCFVCSSVFPFDVPAERRGVVAELLNRLNWRNVCGCWEMDAADGEVRLRTSVPVRHSPLTVELARDVCHINFWAYTSGAVAVLKVAFGDYAPQEALDELDSGPRHEREAFGAILRKMGMEDEGAGGAAGGEPPAKPPGEPSGEGEG